jgi:hypothetical protein
VITHAPHAPALCCHALHDCDVAVPLMHAVTNAVICADVHALVAWLGFACGATEKLLMSQTSHVGPVQLGGGGGGNPPSHEPACAIGFCAPPLQSSLVIVPSHAQSGIDLHACFCGKHRFCAPHPPLSGYAQSPFVGQSAFVLHGAPIDASLLPASEPGAIVPPQLAAIAKGRTKRA